MLGVVEEEAAAVRHRQDGLRRRRDVVQDNGDGGLATGGGRAAEKAVAGLGVDADEHCGEGAERRRFSGSGGVVRRRRVSTFNAAPRV